MILSLAGCGQSLEDAAEDLCNQWSWDSALSRDENIDAYSQVHREVAPETYEGPYESLAREKCPGHFTEYDRAAAEQFEEKREQYGQGGESDSSAGSSTNSSTSADTSIADFLVSRGITDSMVRQLGAKADETGYGLSPGTSLRFEQAQSFAAIIVPICDEVASGQATWSAQITQDVANGASVADAQEMNGYLQDVFCPQAS